MITKISFEGYKGFKNKNELELKPITILIGKNSSGKSAIAKLPVFLSESISTNQTNPILNSLKGIELGAEFRDLLYNRDIQGDLKFEIFNDKNEIIKVQINNDILKNSPIVSKWQYVKNENIEKIVSTEDIQNSNVEFEGIIPSELKDEFLEKFNFETNYLGPFRLNPPRVFNLDGTKDYKRIGSKGENAYQILANSFNNNDSLINDVGNWYNDNFDGWRLIVRKIDPYFEIRITREGNDNEGEINIVDVGQGMSQALPIIVKANMKTSSSLVIIEQPELHLHPAAHGNLAELIVKSTKETDNRYLIETHSENFILRIRRLIAEEKFDPNDIALYSVEYDNNNKFSFIKKINILSDGEVDYWPKDIFRESFEEVKALRNAQSRVK
ncbi:MAG: AAA family ATPase [Flavobacteriales bacterium]|nr:AAA family ATPase [Flavobacteriales bacterium]